SITQIKTDHFSVRKLSVHHCVCLAQNKFASRFEISENEECPSFLINIKSIWWIAMKRSGHKIANHETATRFFNRLLFFSCFGSE
ncbi:MAG: hypothetical protein ACPGQF_06445, partial [Akkermansiaceae bacterium]